MGVAVLTPPPLAIVQARMGSTRLPGKMLLDLGGKPLVWWAWSAAVEAFGAEHVVCAIPASAENDELAAVLATFPANVFRWDGPEADVLGRFSACANTYRWHPHSVIVRITPDDWRKDPAMLRRVAAGERMPVEQGGEAFLLAELWEADEITEDPCEREHITWAFWSENSPPPPCPPGVWTIDTAEDLEAARRMAQGR